MVESVCDDVEVAWEEQAYQLPLELPRESPLPVFLSRLEFWPAAAEAKLDGRLEPEPDIAVCQRTVCVRGRRMLALC